MQSAARNVAQDCRWVMANRRVAVTLQAQQGAINYPSGCSAGSIVSIAVWQDGSSYVLEPRAIGPEADLAVAQATLEGTLDMLTDRPRFFQQRTQIHLWPVTDQQYAAEIEYMQPMDLPNDTDLSVTDGQLIAYMAASILAQTMGDEKQAGYLATLYGDRLAALKGWQSAGTRFAMDSEADLAENEFSIERLKPNWDTRPTTTRP